MTLQDTNANRYISTRDRSFQYGDGGFTTILVKQAKLQLWPFHQQRLLSCLECLSIHAPNWHDLEQTLNQMALEREEGGIKVHVSRGQGGRGYSPSMASQALITLESFDYPPHYHQWRQSGVQLGVCSKRMGLNPLLAGHKHNNRLEQVLLRAEMDLAGYQDGVCLDIHDRIVETTMANLFWVKGRTLYTPKLDYAGVAGVARRHILQSATSLGLTVEIGQFPIDHLADADEVFITNALIEVAPVIGIAHQTYSTGCYSRYFQENFNS